MQQRDAHGEEDRRSRFSPSHTGPDAPAPLRERAASQPPRTADNAYNSLLRQSYGSPPANSASSQWAQARRTSNLSQSPSLGLPQSVPTVTRSASFTGGNPQEDDESEAYSDVHDPAYDEVYMPSSMHMRGRNHLSDNTRSRSQSLAALRPTPIGSPLSGQNPGMWGVSNPLNIPGGNAPYGEGKGTTSRYGSLGALGRSPTGFSSGSPISMGGQRQGDISNISPFVRDVRQILLDDGSAFRELWAGMHPPRDENGGGGSGTTSRRHSVSVVQPRRGVVGFAGTEQLDESSSMTPTPMRSNFSQGGLMLSDDDLAGDLLSLNLQDNPGHSSMRGPSVSQPSSLPVYAPTSRSPPSSDSRYPPLNLAIPGGSFASRPHALRSPSDSGLSTGSSPPRTLDQGMEGVYGSQMMDDQGAAGYNARYVPGLGIQYYPTNGQMVSGSRGVGMHQLRTPTDPGASLADIGKGVPLHAVPEACPLFIVEFKAGRTDLFYCTDPSVDVRKGDLVIVEADRGKDLGKIVNDTITKQEVEDFQRQQANISYGDPGPQSPGGQSTSGKRDINPKRIYSKATGSDAQLLVSKMQDEVKALQLCQSKVRQKKLPMEVIDAEYQWDRRKLTFYFVAEKRIDFRELVRELFRLYKTRIWMASLQGPGGYNP